MDDAETVHTLYLPPELRGMVICLRVGRELKLSPGMGGKGDRIPRLNGLNDHVKVGGSLKISIDPPEHITYRLTVLN